MSVFKRRIEEVSSTASESSSEEDGDREKVSRYLNENYEQNANSSLTSCENDDEAPDRQFIMDLFENSQNIEHLKMKSSALKAKDLHIYKNTQNEKVIYFSNHNKYYTLDEVEQGQLWKIYGANIQHLKMGGVRNNSKDKLIILDSDGKTRMQPTDNRFLHMDHIYRVPAREGEYKYKYGGDYDWRFIQMMPEYPTLLEQAKRNSKRDPCVQHPESKISIRYKANCKGYYKDGCRECSKLRSAKKHLDYIQTNEGKAFVLAESAISTQNSRLKSGNPGLIPLDIDTHRPVLKKIFEILIKMFMEIADKLKVDVKPYHLTNDKLDDDKGYLYIMNGKYLVNVSVTLKINNGRQHVDSPTKKKLCEQSLAIRSGTIFTDSTITPEYMEALELIKTKMEDSILKKTQNVYYGENRLAAEIAHALKNMCLDAKRRQNDRRHKRPNMQQDLCVKTLKIRIIEWFIKSGGRCHVSKLPICFIGDKDRPKASIDRLINSIGYEQEENLSLVAIFFNTELKNVESEELEHLKWTPELFQQIGSEVFSDELRVTFEDIDSTQRNEINDMLSKLPLSFSDTV